MKKITSALCVVLFIFVYGSNAVGGEISPLISKIPAITKFAKEQPTEEKQTQAEAQENKPAAIRASASVQGAKTSKAVNAIKQQYDRKGKSAVGEYTANASDTSLDELRDQLGKTGYSIVLPDAPAAVSLSASDVNRVTCANGKITDVIYSQEKGLSVKYSGKDAFIKFQVTSEGSKNKLLYSSTPSELYFVCDDQVYTIIALPKKIPAQQVKLSSAVVDKIKRNREYFAEIPYEQRLVTVIQRAYKDDFEESWTIQGINKNIDAFTNYQMVHFRNVVIDGEGIVLKEYHIKYMDTSKYPEGGRLEEKMFLTKDITTNTVAIALDKTIAKPNEIVRLFVVETKGEQR